MRVLERFVVITDLVICFWIKIRGIGQIEFTKVVE